MKNLIKATFVLLITLFAISTNGQTIRNVDSFNQLSASSSVKIKLIKSNEQKIEFKMTKGDESNLITEVKNGKLIVKIKSKMFSSNNNTKAAVKVYYTELNDVEASAGASIKAEEPINANEIDLEVSSGAVMDVEVKAQRVEAEASSGGRLLIEGSATNGEYEASSGANIDATLLICDNVNAEASSGGKMKVHANKKLNADASSGGSIRYKGDVDNVASDAGWSGKVKRIN
ncbi:MAG: head GIN domain-containing protein [Bacteroidota bacterium]